VIVGDDELSRDEAVLREMASGEQRQVALSSLGDELRALVRGDMGGEAR
jgi:histidyl-tRNA synthetase